MRLLPQLSTLVFILAAVFYPDADIAAAPVSTPAIFNTGVDDFGEELPGGSKDPHFGLKLPNPAATKDAFSVRRTVLPPTWVDAPTGSAWIGPNSGNSFGPRGDYSYIQEFSLTGTKLENIKISGRWASDNSSRIYLNGIFTDNSIDYINGFLFLVDFTITSGFKQGLNTLEFVVNNAGSGKTGLLVSDLTLVPIPGAIWLFASALVAVIGINRRLKGQR